MTDKPDFTITHAAPYKKEIWPLDNGNVISVHWETKTGGFGEFVFYWEDGKLMCDNECMSKKFIKEVLCKMVDDSELVDPEPEKQ